MARAGTRRGAPLASMPLPPRRQQPQGFLQGVQARGGGVGRDHPGVAVAAAKMGRATGGSLSTGLGLGSQPCPAAGHLVL
jgi:hypothetical protein